MKISGLISLINEFVSRTDLTEKQKKPLSSNIKRQYNIISQDLKSKGRKTPIENLRKLYKPLIENYEKIKYNNSINEVLQLIAEDIRTANIPTKRDQSNMENEIAGIHSDILGNPGTSTKGMSSEYISKIIAKKVANANGLNRDDIMNLLDMQSENMYMDIEQYQKLINDSVIIGLTNNPDGEKFLNPKILKIFASLAASYKVQENYDKVQEIYEQGLRIKSLENTPEYDELRASYHRFLEFLEMKRNFEDRRFDDFESLLSSLTAIITDDNIFVKGKQKDPTPTPNSPTPPHSNYIMPREKKVEGLKRLVNALKRDNSDYDILQYEIGKEAYAGYMIFKIEGTNVSIFENFNDVNARIFIVKNEDIDIVKQLTRNEAAAYRGVEPANHIENFDNYCRNIIRKTRKLIRETQIGIEPPKEDELNFDSNHILSEDDDDKTVTSDGSIDISDNMDGQESATEQPPEEVSKDVTGDITSQNDKIENERKKAFENRKKLQQLEEKLKDIQRNAKEKIENIQSSSEHP